MTAARTAEARTQSDVYSLLMAHAARCHAPTILALAGVLSNAFARRGADMLPIAGLDARQTRAMMARWFPGAEAALGIRWTTITDDVRHRARLDEVEDLLALLMDHADPHAGTAEEANWAAHALACASLGDNHLWQDLFLPSRRELSALIGHWFPRLAAKNDRDMKWKKFFYKQLCERAELFICRAPSCGVCSDYAQCFGPE